MTVFSVLLSFLTNSLFCQELHIARNDQNEEEENLIDYYHEGDHCVRITSRDRKYVGEIDKVIYRLIPIDVFSETTTNFINLQHDFGHKRSYKMIEYTDDSYRYFSKAIDQSDFYNFIEIDQSFIREYIESPETFTTEIIYATNYTLTKGEFIDTSSVICKDSPTFSKLLEKVNQRLIELDYIDRSYDGSIKKTHHYAIEEFQIDHGLFPIGLTLETLDFLGFPGYERFNSNYLSNKKLVPNNTPCVVLQRTPDHEIEEVTFETIVYLGHKVDLLTYTNVFTKEENYYSLYDPNDKLMTVDKNNTYRILHKNNPEDFIVRVNHISEDEIYPRAGITEYDCVCLDDINYVDILKDVEAALSNLGYKVDNLFGLTTKQSLTEFQILNEMPIGFLDHGTLNLLKVDY